HTWRDIRYLHLGDLASLAKIIARQVVKGCPLRRAVQALFNSRQAENPKKRILRQGEFLLIHGLLRNSPEDGGPRQHLRWIQRNRERRVTLPPFGNASRLLPGIEHVHPWPVEPTRRRWHKRNARCVFALTGDRVEELTMPTPVIQIR